MVNNKVIEWGFKYSLWKCTPKLETINNLDDLFGKEILKGLEKENVDETFFLKYKDFISSLSTKNDQKIINKITLMKDDILIIDDEPKTENKVIILGFLNRLLER